MKNFSQLILILAALLITSCNSSNKLTYLQNIASESDTLFKKNKPTYYLQPADILYVRIITQDEDVNKMFNPLLGQGNTSNMQAGNMYFYGFEVKDSGYIEMPILKKIPVVGLNLDEAQVKISEVAETHLKDPQVIVKLHSFEFSVIGEVNNPGMISSATYEVNILEALALAGDISYNGNRQNIVIMRPDQGDYEVYRLDLTDKNIVNSELFFIQPNDVIYVEPLKRTLFRETTSDYMFFVSAMSTVLSLIVLIVNLM